MGIESPIQIIMIFRLKVVLQDMDLLFDVDWSTGPDNNPYSMVL